MSFNKMTVRSKILLLVAACAISIVGYGVWAYNTLTVAKVNGPHYKRIVQGKDLIADILPPPNYIIETYLLALHMANEIEDGAAPETLNFYVSRGRRLKAEFDERHTHWVNELENGDIRRAKTVDCYQPAKAFYQVFEQEFVPACQRRDVETAKQLARGELRDSFQAHRSAVVKTVAMTRKSNAAEELAVANLVQNRTYVTIFGSIGVIAVLSWLGWYVASITVAPFRGPVENLRRYSTQDLTDVSNRLRSNAENTSDQAMMASGAAEQVSANAQSLATAVEQFEESIKEIAANASNAASVASNAVGAAQQTNATVTRLGESSMEIGNVIKVINSIAEQTNLLALNATIEAARAGEAGKGFAVVANEVKELAKETSKATEDIIGRIETIQSDTDEAVSAIGLVSEIISEINESQNAIAYAVEQQTAMTMEISRNIAEVATGSGEIAQNISTVADTANSTTSGADETLATAASIELLANVLLGLVGGGNESTFFESEQNCSNKNDSSSFGGKYRLESAQEDALFV